MSQPQKVDIRGGKLTYGQRIELQKILAQEGASERRRFEQAFACLHPGVEATYTAWWFDYFAEVVDGVKFWCEKESKMLHYDPSADEVSAGVGKLSERLGPMNTVMTLAEKFAQDPDAILEWEYGKVFGLLYADLENFKYRKRLDALQADRARQRSRK